MWSLSSSSIRADRVRISASAAAGPWVGSVLVVDDVDDVGRVEAVEQVAVVAVEKRAPQAIAAAMVSVASGVGDRAGSALRPANAQGLGVKGNKEKDGIGANNGDVHVIGHGQRVHRDRRTSEAHGSPESGKGRPAAVVDGGRWMVSWR